MTPEEKVNQYYWWALEHIKEEILQKSLTIIKEEAVNSYPYRE